VHSATGEGAGLIADRILDADRSLSGRVIHSGKPILVADYLDEVGGSFRLEQPVAAAIGVPLLDGDRVIGAVTVARLVGRSPFTDSDMDQLAGFANHAGVAIELDRGRADRETVRLLSDHDRIAADLHDLVIQELFATGMGLQSMAHRIGHAAHRDQLLNHVDSLDATIRRIRATIFRLQQPERTSGSLRRRVQAVLDEAEPELGLTTEVTFSGPLDDGSVSVGLTEDIVAVLREALSNVARHADASRVDVRVALVGSLITVDVVDNGTGIGPTMRAGGILTMQRRAERRAGQLDVSTPLGGGTRVFWTAQTS
jgi:signal transduction histidine kinase